MWRILRFRASKLASSSSQLRFVVAHTCACRVASPSINSCSRVNSEVTRQSPNYHCEAATQDVNVNNIVAVQSHNIRVGASKKYKLELFKLQRSRLWNQRNKVFDNEFKNWSANEGLSHKQQQEDYRLGKEKSRSDSCYNISQKARQFSTNMSITHRSISPEATGEKNIFFKNCFYSST